MWTGPVYQRRGWGGEAMCHLRHYVGLRKGSMTEKDSLPRIMELDRVAENRVSPGWGNPCEPEVKSFAKS